MEFPANWPNELKEFLQTNYGSLQRVETLSGLSLAQVWRVGFKAKSLVVKVSGRPTETIFYETIASVLQENDIPCPVLEWSLHQAEIYWMVLENIPQSIPREQWLANSQMLKVLRRLHNLTPKQLLNLPGMYRPIWNKEMNDKALDCFPLETRLHLSPLLLALKDDHQYLFEPECLISGDPNPTNWGIRDNGTTVLYDWERFTYGTPALDLSITVPGLGDPAAFEKVAALYLKDTGDSASARVEQLAHDLAIVKLWSFIEYLGEYAVGNASATAGIARFLEIFPGWLKNLSRL